MQEGNKVVLFDFGNLSEASGKVLCRFMDMLEHAAGYIAWPKVARDAKYKAEAEIIEEIANRTDLDPVIRLATISKLKKSVKEYKNQTKIIQDAVPFLKENAKPEEMDMDWLSLFMDKARLVSDEELQLIWSEILAQEANTPRSVSKRLLYILMQMSKKDADRFKRLANLCIDIYEEGEINRIVPVIANFDDDLKRIAEITFEDICALENYGLVKFSELKNSVFTSDKPMIVKYGDKEIMNVGVGKKIMAGSVFYTEAGEELLRICERFCSDDIYNYICDSLKLLKNLLCD